jgi:hypothetical protein
MGAALGLGLLLLAVDGKAESVQKTGGSAIVENAHLDFRIVVSKVLRFDTRTGSVFTNARANETVLVAIDQGGEHRTSASRADQAAVRSVSAAAFAPSASRGSVWYTIAIP